MVKLRTFAKGIRSSRSTGPGKGQGQEKRAERDRHFVFLSLHRQQPLSPMTEFLDLFQVGELAVFLAVVRWVEYRRIERAPLFPTLMKLVNLHLISPQDLINHVEKVSLVTETMVSVSMVT